MTFTARLLRLSGFGPALCLAASSVVVDAACHSSVLGEPSEAGDPEGFGDSDVPDADQEIVTTPVTFHETLRMRVAGSLDDAEEDALGSVTVDSSDLELTEDASQQVVGMRWLLRVPLGVRITAAFVQFEVDEVTSEATALEIMGQAVDDAPAFAVATHDLSARAVTESRVSWSPAEWNVLDEADARQRTSDLSPIIQEVVDRPGWQSGNGLVLLITGSGARVAKSRDGTSGGMSAPLIQVEYDVDVWPSCPACQVDAALYACPFLATHTYAAPSEAFFEPTQVVRLDIEMAAADWRYQLDNPNLEEYRPATVAFCGERVENAAMRFKHSSLSTGSLPLDYAKNPMVLDLNEFVPGQKLRGIRKINLEYDDDVALVAERLNWELMASSGVDVARVNYAEVFVNHEYIGVFTNVERVDRSYASYHWGENDGHLYKHAYCGTFLFEGLDAAAYTDDPRCYEPVPSDTQTDYQDLIHVIDVLNNTAFESLPEALPAVWDVERWIPTMAGLQVLAYGDTPNANANNFYTYYPEAGGPARVALWDLDGGYFSTDAPCEHPADTVHWDLFRKASCYDDLPLFDRVIAVPAWRTEYLVAARDFLLGSFEPTQIQVRVRELSDMLQSSLAADPLRREDAATFAVELEDLLAAQEARAADVRAQLESHGVVLP